MVFTLDAVHSGQLPLHQWVRMGSNTPGLWQWRQRRRGRPAGGAATASWRRLADGTRQKPAHTVVTRSVAAAATCGQPAARAAMEAREEGTAEPQEPRFKAPPPRKPVAPPPPKFSEPPAEPAAAGAEAQAGDGGSEQDGDQDQAAAGSKPPPPRFAAPPPRQPGAANAAKAAAVAAARAAQHATPAQRERMVMEAAANVSGRGAGGCGRLGGHTVLAAVARFV